LALEGRSGPFRVGGSLPACRLADDYLPVGGQGDIAWKGLAAERDALGVGMMIGRPPRRTAAAELDVPRSIPMIGMAGPRL
jgi:hypothetical protein